MPNKQYAVLIRPVDKGETARVQISAPNENDAGMWAWWALKHTGRDPLGYKISVVGAAKAEPQPQKGNLA